MTYIIIIILPPSDVEKDKKIAVSSSDAADPFRDLETVVRNEVNNWTKSVFKVNREIYDGDEAMCRVLEHTIWVSMHYQ